MESKPNQKLLKNILFNNDNIIYLTQLLKKAYPPLDKDIFIKDILVKLPELELKERITLIRTVIEKTFPSNYPETLKLLIDSLKNTEEDENFIFAPYSEYTEVNGCNLKYLKISLDALGEFTKYFSAEFAIREFINKFPEETYNKMLNWSLSKNARQRRLSSEGLRPRLPWGKSIVFDYKKAADILDNLFQDKERFVTRSVANHLNDISKYDTEYVIEKLKLWKNSQKQNEKEMAYIISHSLRTAVKKSNSKALSFLGYNTNPTVEVENLITNREIIRLGNRLNFTFNLRSKKDENLIIDYKIIYPSRNNRISEKVFKLKKISIAAGEIIEISKNHLFAIMTTKKLYEGRYKIILLINGVESGRVFFNLIL